MTLDSFRPKRDAHQAVDDVSRTLAQGYTQVLDADLTAYFDSIPHDRLLVAVARRVTDRHILRLCTRWLRAPVVVERGDGKRELSRVIQFSPGMVIENSPAVARLVVR
jgi:RNA-directed DNA polymerase